MFQHVLQQVNSFSVDCGASGSSTTLLLSYPGFCGIISCLTWSSGAGRVRGVYQMQIWWVMAATVGSGHQCLCVVLIKIEIYALPAFIGLGHCGVAYSDLPPSLSQQAGREAAIINLSFSSYPTSSTLSPRSLPTEDQKVINSLIQRPK